MNFSQSTQATFISFVEKTLKGILILFCAAYVFLDLAVIIGRIFYPYTLDGMEGEGLIQVFRLVSGLPLYTRPTVDYVALIYPPIYYYASAIVARLIGVSFGAMRLVSFISTLLCAIILFLAVREKTRDWFSSWLTVGCFASLFILTDQWFDIARTDMLASALGLLAIYLARENDRAGSLFQELAAGAIFSFAFFTKQQALFVFLAVVVYYTIFNWRTALRITAAFLLTSALLFGLFWFTSNGWFFYYLFTIPEAHKFALSIPGLVRAISSQFTPVPVLLLAGFLPAILQLRKTLKDNIHRYYLVTCLGLIGAGTIGYLNKFAGRNVMVDTYLGLSLLLGLAANWGRQVSVLNDKAHLKQLPMALGWLILILQFGFLAPAFESTKMSPSNEDKSAGDALVAQIKQLPGKVMVPDDNYLPLLAGKPLFFSEMAISEIAGYGNNYAMPEWPALNKQIHNLIHASSTVSLMVDYLGRYQKEIYGCSIEKIHYVEKSTFIPITGSQTRPNLLISCNSTR